MRFVVILSESKDLAIARGLSALGPLWDSAIV